MILFALFLTVSSQASLRNCLEWALSRVAGPPIKVEYRKFARDLNAGNIHAETVRVFSENLGKDRAELIGQYWAARLSPGVGPKVSGEVFRPELIWMQEQLRDVLEEQYVLDTKHYASVLADIETLLQKTDLNYWDVVRVTGDFISPRREALQGVSVLSHYPIWIAHEMPLDELILTGGAPIDSFQILKPRIYQYADGRSMDGAEFVLHDLEHARSGRVAMTQNIKVDGKFLYKAADRFSQRIALNAGFLNWVNRIEEPRQSLLKAVWFYWTHEVDIVLHNGKLFESWWSHFVDLFFFVPPLSWGRGIHRRIQNPDDFGQLFRYRDPGSVSEREVKRAVRDLKGFLSRIRWVEK